MARLAVLTLIAQILTPPPPPRPVAPPPPPPPALEFKPSPVCEAYWNAGAVFSGEVIDVRQSGPMRVGGFHYPAGRELIVRIERTWRGDPQGEVPVQVSADVSTTEFKVGEKYLFYTSSFAPHLRISGVSPTKRLSEAAGDLAYFERAKRPVSGATVTGTIVFDDEKRRAPASGYRVRMGSAEREWTAESDADGVFRITGLAAGSYGIRVEVPDGMKVRGPARITISDPHACSQPEFRILAAGSVELFVLETTGKPAVRTILELIDVDSLSEGTPKVLTAHTHADGSVGWADVPTNVRYIIGLNATRVPDPRRPQPILFYPGVPDIASAHIFEVGLAEKVQLETLRLPEPPARLNVTGVVVRADGSPVRGADVVLKSAARLSKGRPVGTRVRTDAQGRFSLPGVAGYRYVVEVSLSVDGEQPRLYAVGNEFLLDAKTAPLRITQTPKSKIQTPNSKETF